MNLNTIRKIRPLYRLLAAARWHGGRAALRLCHALFGVQKNRVFFSSFMGRRYCDNPARICEALHEIRPDAELVWQLQDATGAPDYVRIVRPHSLAALKMIATARVLVDNYNRPHYTLKFSDQKYVQTWHGDRGFKKMLFDMNDGQVFPDGDQMDLAVSGSDFATKNYRTAFHYYGEVMQLGMPRNDALLNHDPAAIARLRRQLDVPDGVRVLLYTPTLRDDRAGEAQQAGFDLGRALDRLEESTGAKWLCLIRAHNNHPAIIAAHDARIRDVTAWPETAELLLCADMLITDYSSAAGDYVLLNRPLILFQPDLDDFIETDREMYFDLRQSPYPRAESEAELMSMLDDIENLIPACAEVLRFYGATETGHSAQAVAQWISQRL